MLTALAHAEHSCGLQRNLPIREVEKPSHLVSQLGIATRVVLAVVHECRIVLPVLEGGPTRKKQQLVD